MHAWLPTASIHKNSRHELPFHFTYIPDLLIVAKLHTSEREYDALGSARAFIYLYTLWSSTVKISFVYKP